MANKDKITFQPKESTMWGYDTVALYRRYDSKKEALLDRVDLIRRGWFIDSAYPHPYAAGWETHAVRKHNVSEA